MTATRTLALPPAVVAEATTCDDDCTLHVPPAAPTSPPTAARVREHRLRRWAWGLTALTLGWNSLETIVAVVSGLLVGSVALVGFGLDSAVEVSSALVIVWRLSRQGTDHAANERAERRAVRLIAISFFGIAAYVVYDAVTKLLQVGQAPEHSPVGLAIVTLSLLVMPALAWAKRRVAAALGSAALKADAAETQFCTYLSVVVLVGLLANSLFGWWWMDPLAGLGVAALAIKEGLATWQSGDLCAAGLPLAEGDCAADCGGRAAVVSG